MRFRASLSFAALALASLAASSQTAPAPKPAGAPATEHVQKSAPPQVVAQTPPMGWNSWNYFHGKVTDQDIRNAADELVATGMKDAGYIYVNIDDTWEGDRDANGVLHTNSKFPDMKALADYVHSKGLKLGIYSSPGPQTCARYAGSLDHEQQDADLYASWGIDYLKYDLCGYRAVMQQQAPNDKAEQMRMMQAAYLKMDKALKATGRPILYSLCQYGWDAVWEWGPKVGANAWRTTGDIQPNWQSIYSLLNEQAGLAKYAGPGHWNDPDMLEVGNGKLTLAENRTHFSMWAMLAAPLLAGNDLPNMTPEVKIFSPIVTSSPSIRTSWATKRRVLTLMARSTYGRGAFPAEPWRLPSSMQAPTAIAPTPSISTSPGSACMGRKRVRTCGPARL